MVHLLLLLFLCVLALVLLSSYLKFRKDASKLKGIPGKEQFLIPALTSNLPLFLQRWVAPHFTSMDEVFFGKIPEMRAKHGNIFKMVFGGMSIVMIAGDGGDFSKQLVTKGSKMFHKAASPLFRFLNQWIGENLFSISDELSWRRHRLLINPAFAESSLKGVQSVTENITNRLMKHIDENPVRNVRSDTSAITLDVIGLAAFGFDMGCTAKNTYDLSDTSTLSYHVNVMCKNFLLFQMLPESVKRLPFGFPKQFTHSLNFIKSSILKVIESRANGSSNETRERDLLDLLLEQTAQSEQDIAPLSRTELVSNCVLFFLAGLDTTQRVLEMALLYLAKNKTVQDKARKEADSLSEEDWCQIWTRWDRKLPYHEAIVHEVLRLYPPSTGVSRNVCHDVHIKNTDIVIPKDAYIVMDYTANHRLTEYWGNDAHEFVPERWFDSVTLAVLKKHRYLYTPFGIGARSCIGKKFALLEAVLVLAKLLKRYTITCQTPNDPKTSEPFPLSMEVTLGLQHAPTLRFSQR